MLGFKLPTGLYMAGQTAHSLREPIISGPRRCAPPTERPPCRRLDFLAEGVDGSRRPARAADATPRAPSSGLRVAICTPRAPPQLVQSSPTALQSTPRGRRELPQLRHSSPRALTELAHRALPSPQLAESSQSSTRARPEHSRALPEVAHSSQSSATSRPQHSQSSRARTLLEDFPAAPATLWSLHGAP